MRRSQRALVYGAAGLLFEVAFTGVRGPVRDRDWRLASHTYLWMFPIYASAAVLFEPAHDAIRARPWWQRGLVYTASIYGVEVVSGEALRGLTGQVPWDYAPRYRDHWRGVVRASYAPVWFGAGLALERLHDRLSRPGR